MCIRKSGRKNSSTVELTGSFSHFLHDFIRNSQVSRISSIHPWNQNRFQTSSCANGRHSSWLQNSAWEWILKVGSQAWNLKQPTAWSDADDLLSNIKSDKTEHFLVIFVIYGLHPTHGIKDIPGIPKPPSFIINQRLIEVDMSNKNRWKKVSCYTMRNLGDQRDVVPDNWLESPRDSVDFFLNFEVFIFSLTSGGVFIYIYIRICIYKGDDKIEFCRSI